MLGACLLLCAVREPLPLLTDCGESSENIDFREAGLRSVAVLQDKHGCLVERKTKEFFQNETFTRLAGFHSYFRTECSDGGNSRWLKTSILPRSQSDKNAPRMLRPKV